MNHIRSVLIVLATLVPLTTVAQTQSAPFTPVTDAMLATCRKPRRSCTTA